MDELIHLKNKINIIPQDENMEKQDKKKEGKNKDNKTDKLEEIQEAIEIKEEKEEEREKKEKQDILKIKYEKLGFYKSLVTNKSNNQNPNEFSIYVSELDPSVNEEILTNFFKEKYKSVINSKIIIDPSTKISKGYGFVKFSNKEESEKAITEMNGQTLNGKIMKTGTASYKKNKTVL